MAEKANRSLRLPGKGNWRRHRPLYFEVVGGSRPYLWIGQGPADHEDYITSLSPGEARKLRDFLTENLRG